MNPKGKYKMSISGLWVCLIEGVRLIGGLLNRGFTGCLPFTRAKPVIHGLGNWTQNTGLVNFILESRFHLYKSVPFTWKRPPRPETGIKDGLEEMEQKFLLGIFCLENSTTFSDVPLLLEIFCWNDPKRRVPFTFQLDFVNGKQPL